MSRGTGVAPSAGANTFASTDWSTATLDAADYYSFSVAPSTGYTLRLDSLRFSERRSSTGIRDWALRSSLDNFTANIITVNVPDNTDTRTNKIIALPKTFEKLDKSVEFRIYGYNAEAAPGSWRIDDVRVNGAAVVSTPTGVSSAKLAGNVLVYPNPATDQLNIRVAGRATKAAVTVTDLMGRTVLKGKAAADGTFSLRSLPAGNYMVLVQDGNTQTSHKVSKQ
ncbi:T9SS type A sorting domain-containing protein [Hymenobacter sp. ISL-91]|uniref:T9SS type A sorting domain-containing protein n=1 Tax=Hymenobacter sp. ISL-91 TaxID=2819151 RepID=UPI001BE99A51|nr:T9SS type A sorting domain-containing protein [Hymenobacter sp. ISL-91]MBT2556609.1 T9SS type A sorting domain-containing protein [Hymenobacter sp. ISL-91]